MTKTKNEGVTALALQDTEDVPGLIANLDKAIKKIKVISDTPFKTQGSLEGFPTNIKSEQKVENLIRALSKVNAMNRDYELAAGLLGLDTYPPFDIGGSLADWTHDIKLRIQIIQQQKTLDTLNKAKEFYSKFVSEADQKRMFGEQLVKELAGLGVFQDPTPQD